jgi:hypothetical protein
MTECAVATGIDSMSRKLRVRQRSRRLVESSDTAMAAVAQLASRQTLAPEAAPRTPTPAPMLAVTVETQVSEPVDVAQALRHRAFDEFITPLVRAQSREAFYDLVLEKLNLFIDASEAVRVTRKATGASTSTDRSFMEKYYERIAAVAGPEAGEELRFDVATMVRVSKLTAKIAGMEVELEEEFASEFATQLMLHTVGVVGIMNIASGAEHSQVGMDQCFELARGGALRAYAAVRNAFPPRRAAESVADVPTRLDFDAEDAHLAGFSAQ